MGAGDNLAGCRLPENFGQASDRYCTGLDDVGKHLPWPHRRQLVHVANHHECRSGRQRRHQGRHQRDVYHRCLIDDQEVLTIGPGQCVPWHRHTAIEDTFFCLEGPMVVETREPDANVLLQSGQRASVPRGQVHRVAGVENAGCKFVIVQGVGKYDYLPEA